MKHIHTHLLNASAVILPLISLSFKNDTPPTQS